MSEAFYIIDGYAYSYQSFYALSGLYSPEGKPTNAIYGFLKMIYKILEEKQPQYLAVCFDLPSPVFRSQIFTAYKANRKPMPEDMREQIGIIKEVLSAYPIAILEQEGFEADDLMATLARHAHDKGIDVYLVTPDKDIAQVLKQGIQIFDPKKNLIIESKDILEKYQIPPENLSDYFALIGDKIDNIPGVNGIGPKKAVQLLQDWKSLENLYQNLDKIEPDKVKKCLETYREDAFLSKRLFSIQDNVEISFGLENYKVREKNSEKLLILYKKLGFVSLIKEILESIPVKNLYPAKRITQEHELEEILAELKEQSSFTIAIENEPEQSCWEKKISTISLGWGENKVVYIECNSRGLEKEKVLEILHPVLSQGPEKNAYSLKEIYTCFATQGVFLEPLGFDISLASYILEPTDKPLKLENLCLNYLGEAMPALLPENKEEYWGAYLNLLIKLEKQMSLSLTEKGLFGILQQKQIPLIPIVSEMERLGILLSREALQRDMQSLREKVSAFEKKIYELAGEKFAINSIKKIAYILFEKLQLPKTKKTKTGYTVSVPALEELAKYHELPGLIVKYKELEKVENFYHDHFFSWIHSKTSRIHPQYFPNRSITGQIVSSAPDIEKIEKDIPSVFIASSAHIFVKAQYNQIELRLLAHFAHSYALEQDIQNNSVSQENSIVEWIDKHAHQYKEVQEFMDQSIKKAEQEKCVITISQKSCSIPEIASSQKELKKNAQDFYWKVLLEGSAWDIQKDAMIRIHKRREEEMIAFFSFCSITHALIFEVIEEEKEKFCSLVGEEMEKAASAFLSLPIDIVYGKNWEQLQK